MMFTSKQDLPPRQKAQTTTKTRKQLDRQGYFYMGDLNVEYTIATCDGVSDKNCSAVKQDDTPSARLLVEAAAKGADLVKMKTNNVIIKETRSKQGSCVETERSNKYLTA